MQLPTIDKPAEAAFFYEPSGQYMRAGLWGVPLGTALLSSAAGALYTWLTFNPFPNKPISDGYVFIFLGWALLTFLAAAFMVRLFKMRDKELAELLTCIGATAGCFCSFLVLKYLAAPDEPFLEFVGERLREGIKVARSTRIPRDKWVEHINGLLLLGGWLMEYLIIGGAAILGSKWQVSRPFSETSGKWLKKKPLPLLAILPEGHEHIRNEIADGNLQSLRHLEASASPKHPSFAGYRPFLVIFITSLKDSEEYYVSITLHKGRARPTIVKNLELSARDATFLINKFGQKSEQ